ncbi:MAG: helix-turn-helix domain-containing protein [Chitinophagaceae bacterium]|nr:helix-turn-helix domain-containing protein [Chitinophagaceae bacterium]
MKSVVEKSSIPESRIFVIKELKEKHFDNTWHAHHEYQLFVVLKGTGTRFIGDTVKSFAEGDITFLGPEVPHLWRSDSIYFNKKNKQYTHGLVIYFRHDFIGDLLEKEEMHQVKSLFEKARRGIEYNRSLVPGLTCMMRELIKAHGAESLIQFLQILNLLAASKEYRLLHNEDYKYKLKETETQRINIVYNYAAQHFQQNITLNEVAALLNMTPTSFSRYFKTKTSKSFTDFLSELRIKNACKLLVEDDRKTINQIGYECGYNALSNFNRQFKAFMKMTPKSYREKFATL